MMDENDARGLLADVLGETPVITPAAQRRLMAALVTHNTRKVERALRRSVKAKEQGRSDLWARNLHAALDEARPVVGR